MTGSHEHLVVAALLIKIRLAYKKNIPQWLGSAAEGCCID